MERGKIAEELLLDPDLTPEERAMLDADKLDGELARAHLIRANLDSSSRSPRSTSVAVSPSSISFRKATSAS